MRKHLWSARQALAYTPRSALASKFEPYKGYLKERVQDFRICRRGGCCARFGSRATVVLFDASAVCAQHSCESADAV